MNVDKLLLEMFQCKLPTEDEIQQIITKSKELLIKEDNILNLKSPITICGDIHGQFYDLIELFKITGLPPHTTFLFLGDYVDRGFHSIEVMTLLLLLKLKHSQSIHLLRGNHESRQITQVYGFYDECMRKFSVSLWKSFTDLFDLLPLAAIIDNEIFNVHGGLSPVLSIDELKEVDRKKEVPHTGMMCDILWSDPDAKAGFGNSPRGAGFMFGPDITNKFCEENGFKSICRAHQLAMNGYMTHHDEKVVTVFSAPNYCYRCGNLATVMEVSESGVNEFVVFESAPNEEEEINIVDYFK